MQLQKTDKARAELQGGSRTLGQRERALLILADGKTTVHAVDHLFNGQAQILAHQLIEAGYLVGIDLKRPASPRAAPLTAAPEPEPAPPTANAADRFEGKRSLATTRMFLFDICERMFVRRAPEQAEALEQLRALWNGYRIAVHTALEAPPAGVDTLEDLERVRDLLGKA